MEQPKLKAKIRRLNISNWRISKIPVQIDRRSVSLQCTHMWLHWVLLSYGISPFIFSYRLFVFFNNANTVSAEIWVWDFINHWWYKSLVWKSLGIQKSCQVIRLRLMTCYFQNPISTHISYSQYFYSELTEGQLIS